MAVSCDLMGGLGNQFFQIATTLAYSWTHDIPAVFHKIHHSPSIFKPKPVYWDSYFHTLSTQITSLDDAWVYQEPRFEYDALPQTKTDMLLRGYFQSYRYFDSYRSEILKLFQLPKSTIDTIHQQYEPENWDTPIAVHIRRGDYLKLKKKHPVLSESNYYQKALEQFPDNANFIVFSDDINWCKRAFKIISTPRPYRYIRHYRDRYHQHRRFHFIESTDINELYLMTRCHHHIIANSSFSWWGAYMSSQTGTVVAPTLWFGKNNNRMLNDLLFDHWKTV
tara:strand:- start:79 stop:915 length:837 start_codon:yes stop_codon:yes gene_type:complete